MAFSVKLYTMRKVFNSTKRPEENQYYLEIENVTLNDPTDMVHPVFKFSPFQNAAPLIFNYMRVDNLSKYFFIDRWAYERGLWIAYCTVDVLASYKPSIGISSQYVVRSWSSRDPDIADAMYPLKSTPVVDIAIGSRFFADEFDSGCFVIGVVNRDSNAIASTSYYALTRSNMRTLCSQLLDIDVRYGDIQEISKDLLKNFIDPLQYITSCMWFPFHISEISEASIEGSSIPYGFWSYTVPNRRIYLDSIHIHREISGIPSHPQRNLVGRYVNNSPYTRVTLIDPILGTTTINPSLLRDSDTDDTRTLYFDFYIDLMSGAATCQVSSPLDMFASQVSIGVPVSISQMTQNYLGAAASSLQALGSAFKGKVGATYASMASMAENMSPNVTSKGGSGNTSVFELRPSVMCEFYELVDPDPERLGEPLCKEVVINTLTGYIQCANVKLDIACLGEEQKMIVDYMNGGFYYE